MKKILADLIIIISMGCEAPHRSDPYSLEHDFHLASRSRPAALLPPGQAHKVKVLVSKVPPDVSTEDVGAIASIVGRLAGIKKYEIKEISYVEGFDGLQVVVFMDFVQVVRTNGGWIVIGGGKIIP